MSGAAGNHWTDLTPAHALGFLQGDHDATGEMVEAMHSTGGDDEERTLTAVAAMTHLLAKPSRRAAATRRGGSNGACNRVTSSQLLQYAP